MEKGLSVPLPNQVPSPVDLSVVPEHILRSGAVESLIQQNEDLMARLAVALRRNSLLEERVSEVEQSLKAFKHRYDVMQDQVLVLREKDQVLLSRTQKAQEESAEARQALTQLETRYAELYTSSKDRQSQLMENLEALARRVSRHIHHRRRLYRVALSLRHEIRDLKNRLENLDEQLVQEKTAHHELKDKLGQAAEHIQNQAKEAESNQRQLVSSYEDQLKALRESLKEAQAKCLVADEKLAEMGEVYEANVDLQNERVTLLRSLSEIKQQREEELQQMQQQLSEFRREAKAKTLELERLRLERDEARELAQLEKQEKHHLSEQVESLQCLWDENQREISAQREKIASLQKLNQQISTHLNDQRRELKELREQAETAEFQARQKLQVLKSQLQQIWAQPPTPLNLSPQSAPDEEKLEPEWMTKVDSLIAEIQGAAGPSTPAGEPTEPEETSPSTTL